MSIASTKAALARRFVSLTLIAAVAITTTFANVGCFTQSVPVGSGATGGQRTEYRQWFILWGLVPLTNIDNQVAGATEGATNYNVKTEFTPIDVLIGLVTGFVTIYPKSVVIEQ